MILMKAPSREETSQPWSVFTPAFPNGVPPQSDLERILRDPIGERRLTNEAISHALSLFPGMDPEDREMNMELIGKAYKPTLSENRRK